MSKIIFLLPILAIGVFSVNGQSSTCPTTAINTYISCLSAIDQSQRQQMQSEMQQWQNAASACFTNSGCVDDRACFEAIGKQRQSTLDSCVQSATGYNVQNLDSLFQHHGGCSMMSHGGSRGGSGSWGHNSMDHQQEGSRREKRHGGRENEGFLKACNNNSANAVALEQCLQGLFNQSRSTPNPQSNNFTAEMQQMIGAFNSCNNALMQTAGCNRTELHAAYDNAMKAIKTCKEQQCNSTNSSLSSIGSSISQCNKVNLTAIDERRNGHGKGSNSEGHQGGHGNYMSGQHRQRREAECNPQFRDDSYRLNGGQQHPGAETQGNLQGEAARGRNGQHGSANSRFGGH